MIVTPLAELVLLQRFQVFAKGEAGISLDHPDDWEPWFTCFKAGALAALSDDTLKVVDSETVVAKAD